MDVLWKENNVLYNVLCVLITENEKLFDRSDNRLYWSTVFHIMGVFHHGYASQAAAAIDIDSIEAEEVQVLKKYQTAYLTAWNFGFQMTFLCLALAHDVLQWLDKHDSNLGKKIKYFRDIIFNGMVVPFTCFVTGTFWGLYAIDRELVFPKVYDQVLPWWLNQCVHTNILVVVIMEFLLTRRRDPTDQKIELYMYWFILVTYTVICDSIYIFGGVWLYNIFGVLTWWQVVIYQSVNTFLGVVFYHAAFKINRMIHKDITVVKESKATNTDLESKDTFDSSGNSNNKKGATVDPTAANGDLESKDTFNGSMTGNIKNGAKVDPKAANGDLESKDTFNSSIIKNGTTVDKDSKAANGDFESIYTFNSAKTSDIKSGLTDNSCATNGNIDQKKAIEDNGKVSIHNVTEHLENVKERNTLGMNGRNEDENYAVYQKSWDKIKHRTKTN